MLLHLEVTFSETLVQGECFLYWKAVISPELRVTMNFKSKLLAQRPLLPWPLTHAVPSSDGPSACWGSNLLPICFSCVSQLFFFLIYNLCHKTL